MSQMKSSMITKTKVMIYWMEERVKRREKEDSKKILMREIIYVVVGKVICPMLHCILMPRLSIKVYFQKGLLIYKRRENKTLVQIVGK